MFSKKAISPVVATALLLVVAVVSVVGFSGWFNEFSSSVFVDIETKSSGKSLVSIENIIGENLYLKSDSNVSITSIKINDIDCNINKSLNGLNKFNILNCIENVIGSVNIVVVTTAGIFETYKYISSSVSLDCDSLNGGEWVKVQEI